MEVQRVGAALAPFQSQGDQDPCVLPGRTPMGSSYSQLLFQGEKLSLAGPLMHAAVRSALDPH